MVLCSVTATPFVGGDVCVLEASVVSGEPLGNTSAASASGVVSMASSSTAATSTATLLAVGSWLLEGIAGSCVGVSVKSAPSCMSASSRSWRWPPGANVVMDELMSISAGGRGETVCAWST